MDKRLKQRLLGAAVIVALAVIFVPELVKQSPSQDPLAVSQEIPPRPAALTAVSAGTVQLPSEVAATQNGAAAADNAQDLQISAAAEDDNTVPALAAAAIDESFHSMAAEEKREAQSPPAQSPPAQSPEGQRPDEQEEQRRLERQKAEADQAARQLAEAEARLEADEKQAAAQKKTAETSKATVAEAETDKKSVSLPKLQLISPNLYQQEKPAKNSPSRWVVQAGSFADSQNARLLRERLRTLQFQVSMNQATVDGQTRYRVQLGPHVSRAESERIRERLLREAGIPSSVVPVYN